MAVFPSVRHEGEQKDEERKRAKKLQMAGYPFVVVSKQALEQGQHIHPRMDTCLAAGCESAAAHH